MPDIKKLLQLKENLKGKNIKIVAVSKTYPAEDIQEVYNAGHRIFGENKAQEIKDKQPLLPREIEWHFIGHLQRNKVKYITPFVSLIHSADSYKLLKEINKEAGKSSRVIDCLLQIHIASEDTKYGFSFNEVESMLNEGLTDQLKNVRICGVMGMATLTPDTGKVRNEFRELKGIFDTLKAGFFKDKEYFKEISMGMSGDYEIAIEEGSTIIRVGSLIFGERQGLK